MHDFLQSVALYAAPYVQIALYVIAFSLLAAAYAAVWLARKITQWKREGRKLEMDVNYVSPAPALRQRFARTLVARALAWLFIGPVKRRVRSPRSSKG